MQIPAPLIIDLYKPGHMNMYDPGMTDMYFNWTARDDKYGRWLPDFDGQITFFGLQVMCKDLLIDNWNETFFGQPKEQAVGEYIEFMDTVLPPGSVKPDKMNALHDLGYLPIKIKALPEGKRVPIKVPCFTVRNTVPGFGWLGGYLETQISTEMWKPITSATISHEYRRLFEHYANVTGSPLDFVQFQGHDFSLRGMSGRHDGATAQQGHLLYFRGSDSVSAIWAARKFYGPTNYWFAGSIPASEHSIVSAGGIGIEDEEKTFLRIIKEVYPSGPVSYVSDTRNLWDVLEMAGRNKEAILSRIPDAIGLAKVVFRPDSGNPVNIICGDPKAAPGTPEHKGALRILWEIFGGTTTSKGFKLLHERVGLIYGDSITLGVANEMLKRMTDMGFASACMVFGIGSYTFQAVTRDTFGQAWKGTWCVVNGVARDMFKDPITDNGLKRSLRGLIRVEHEGGRYVAYDRQTPEQEKQGCLREVFRDSKMIIDETFPTLRKRAGYILD